MLKTPLPMILYERSDAMYRERLPKILWVRSDAVIPRAPNGHVAEKQCALLVSFTLHDKQVTRFQPVQEHTVDPRFRERLPKILWVRSDAVIPRAPNVSEHVVY